MVKNLIIPLVFVFMASIGMAPKSKLIVYFDLGNTIINTTNGYDQLTWMPGAEDYLEELITDDIRTGLLINVPEEWGETYSEKIDTLKAFIKVGWKEELPLDWDQFEVLIIPMTNEERKPSPVLFQIAKCYSLTKNYNAFYQGEVLEEIAVSRAAGIPAFLVGSNPNGPFFATIEEMRKTIHEQTDLEVDCSNLGN